MSSLVQAKCTSSATLGSTVSSPSTSGASASRRLRRYSIALTPCAVTRSVAARSATVPAVQRAEGDRGVGEAPPDARRRRFGLGLRHVVILPRGPMPSGSRSGLDLARHPSLCRGLEDNAPVDRPRTSEPPVRAVAAPRPDRTGRVAGVVGLLIVVAVASALAGPWHPPINEARPIAWTPPTASTPPMPTPAGPEDIIATMHIQPWDLSWLGWTLAGAAIAWLLYMIMRWFVRHPAPKAEEGPDDAGIEQGDAYTGPGVALPNLPTLRSCRFVRPTDA